MTGDTAPGSGPDRPPAASKPTLARRVLRTARLAITALAIALVLAECGLRLAGVGWPRFHQPDRTYGVVLSPGAEGSGRAWVSINADGFRDVRHPTAKRPGTLRIAVLGDDVTLALDVPRQETFWSLLGERLTGCAALAGQDVETMSFGVGGYATAQELLVLQQRVWRWSPDVVVLALATGDDVADNSPALGAVDAPFFRLDGDRLVLDASRARSLGAAGRARAWMLRHSRVLQLVDHLHGNLRACGRLGACAEAADADRFGRRAQIYREPADDRWREAWRVTEALLRAMRDDVAAHHARFFLVTLSNGIQVHPDPQVREAFRAAVGAPDLFYPDRRLGEAAARDGIPSLALAPLLAAHVEREHHYLHGFSGEGLGAGPWNREGHQLAAETIAPWLCERLAP